MNPNTIGLVIIFYIVIIFIGALLIVFNEIRNYKDEQKTEWEKYWDETFERNRNL